MLFPEIVRSTVKHFFLKNSDVSLSLSVVDITVYHNGFHGDLNETFFVGEVDEPSRKLVQTAYECMMKGVAIGE